MLQGWGAKGTLVYCWGEHTLVQTLEKIVWRLLRKLKLDLPYDPVNALQDISKNKTKNTNSKRYMNPKVHGSIIYNNANNRKVKEAIWMTIDRWMDKDVASTYTEKQLSHKEWNFAICNNMDELEGYYAKWNTSDREGLGDIPYMWNLNNTTTYGR